MKQLSIIIPALGSQSHLDDTLVSVLENRPQDCDVILVHPADYVDPYDLSDEIRLVASPATELVGMLNLGFQASRSAAVHILLPGVTVTADWCAEPLAWFDQDRNVGAVAPSIAIRGSRRAVHGVAYHAGRGKRFAKRPHQPIVGPLIHAGFYRASALQLMRGFDIAFAEYADVELGLRLRAANYTAKQSRTPVTAASRIRWRPPRGLRGGRMRRRLFRRAVGLGLTKSSRCWRALLSEFANNRFRPSAAGSLIGWIDAQDTARSASIVAEPTATDAATSRRAA